MRSATRPRNATTRKGSNVTITDALGNITRYEYDAAGNLTKETDPLGNVTTYTYDANGTTLTETETRTVGGVNRDAARPRISTTTADRPTKVTYPDGSSTETDYNSIGKQSATQRPARAPHELTSTTTMGRLVRTTYPDDTTEKTDLRRRRTASRSSSIAPAAPPLTSTTQLGRLVKTTYPDGSLRPRQPTTARGQRH